MTNEDRALIRFKMQYERGCHPDLSCLCPALWKKIEELREAMGDANWQVALETIICNACMITTPPPQIDPGKPINEGTTVVISDPQDPIEERIQVVCVPPSLADFTAAAQSPVDETPGSLPGGTNA